MAKSKKRVAALVGIGLAFSLCIGAITTLAIKLDRQTTTTTVGGEAYSIGTIDEKGLYKESESSIYLRKAVTTDGLTCDLADEAKVTYQIFYYDKDGKFISASEELSADYSESAPEGATQAKIVITPTADEDGKVGLTEVFGYAAQLTVTTNR